jgi:D-alanyl-D-alanine dipeptidase
MRLTTLSFIFVSFVSSEANILPSNCQQCLLVTTTSWSATSGELMTFERNDSGSWHLRGISIPCRVGKTGLAWGRGLPLGADLPGPRKVEGDNKAPAGIFRLVSAFGYAAKAPVTRMHYLPLSQNIVGVDDPRSRYYNQLVDRSKIRQPDWRSAEKMILADDRYKWGIVVEHNVPPEPGAGSCIFLHVWKDPQTATTGCTAMPELAMIDLIGWLDPARHPLLIELPAPLYRQLSQKWNLPAEAF